ncbi:MAG: hypothetical protein ABIU63_08330 [Chitinophagaceae bacterium]
MMQTDLPDNNKTDNNDKPLPKVVVLPDECGDSLWEDVLASQKLTAAEINKHINPGKDDEDPEKTQTTVNDEQK